MPGIYNLDKPSGALAWLSGELADGKARGVIVVVIPTDADEMQFGTFGEIQRAEMTFAGAILTANGIEGSE